LERLHAEDRAEEAEEDQMQHLRGGVADECDQELDGEQNECRPEGDDEGEEDDVGRSRPAHGEELGVLAEQVEERLCEREAGSGQELCAACGRNAQSTPPRDARELHVCDCHRRKYPSFKGWRPGADSDPVAVDGSAARPAPAAVSRAAAVPARLLLSGIVAASFLLRFVAALWHTTPLYFPDEYIYSGIARSPAG